MIFFRKKLNYKIDGMIKFLLILFFIAGIICPKSAYANPVITDVRSSDVTNITARITWTTDTNSNSYVDYGETTAYGSTRGNAGDSLKSHRIDLDGLEEGHTYFFRVRSTDGGGETINDNGGSGYTFSTNEGVTITSVRLAEVTNSSATITWDTNVNTYAYLAYGNTSAYGQLIGNEDDYESSHSMTVAGLGIGVTKHYRPRAKDLDGNIYLYTADSTFTTGAPYLTSFSSSTANGIYGPSDAINITANYTDSNGDNLGVGSSMVVILNTGVQVVLDTVGTNKMTGTYVVGATGSGENTTDLNVTSIVSQHVCDTNNYCDNGLTMPSSNIYNTSDIYVDTVAPVFSSVQPTSSATINSVTSNSDISYTLSEGLTGPTGTIKITETGGSLDASSPHTCILTGSYLNGGAHNNFDTTNCSGGAITLVDGATYTFDFDGEDPAGNQAVQVSKAGVKFDTTPPQLQSFASTTANGTYGPDSPINIRAIYNENLGVGSSIAVSLDTGVSINLTSITAGSSLSGTYTVGATGSGQNTNDLSVSSISGQSAYDVAGNLISGTGLPATNISDGSDIVIDTIAPNSPSLVQFITDPIKESNKYNVTLRVDGEANSTILYSIDDTEPSTDPAVGTFAMEGDGSTDVTGLNVSGLWDGTLTATVRLRDAGQNISGSANDTVTKDTTGPTFSIQYYSDSGLTNSLGDNPHLMEGTYYMKISSNEGLSTTPTVSINAQGGGNDVAGGATELVSGNDYKYTRNIVYDAAADGTGLENISITGQDNYDNTSSNIDPTNEALKAAYTDTIKPLLSSGNISLEYVKAGTAVVSLLFSEPMDQAVTPTVVITKSDSSDLTASGNYSDSTHWSGSVTVSSGDANGTATLKVSGAKDLAQNQIDANNNVDTCIIDTAAPTFQVNDGASATPVKSDTINIGVGDTGGSGLVSQFYGFSSDSTCNESDTIGTIFSSGVDFTITGNHTTDYLCVKATDNAANVAYQTVGALHVDNSAPTIISINSSHSNGRFRVGESIGIGVTFSEAVISTGAVLLSLDSGGSCSFIVSSSNVASCTYVVGSGQNSSDLNVQSISGVIKDEAGNDMTDPNPAANLADNKDIIIDTLAPIINITAPVESASVKGSTTINFTDSENNNPECSIDNTNWIGCTSGSTKMSDFAQWSGLPEGDFTLHMRDTDLAGNTGTTNRALVKDITAPKLSYITSDTVDNRYKTGDVIDVDIYFTEPVTSDGDVTVTLDSGGSCSFSISDYNFQTCNYVVGNGDSSNDLNSISISGTIYDQAGNPLTDFYPPAGESLADHKNIIIDTIKPTVSNVTSDKPDATYLESDTIDIDVTFSENVTSGTGFITVTLDSGGSCTFTISDSNFGTCDYFILNGQNSSDLNVSNISGTIRDMAGNLLTNYTPATNLADNKAIQVDTTNPGRPTITDVNSGHANGTFKAGEVIDIDFTFSEPVNSTGYIGVTLNSGGSCTFTVTGSSTTSCDYTVLPGENAVGLNVDLVAGTIKDLAGNAMNNFTPAVNMVSHKDIVIDTTAPDAPSVTMTDPITEANKTAVEITGIGEIGASISYSIDDTNSLTSPVTGTGAVNEFGTYTISGIDVSSLDSGNVTATVYLTDVAGNQSLPGTDTVNSQVIRPIITSISSDHPDGSSGVGEVIDIDLTFSQYVTSAGDVTVTLETGTTDRSCTFTVTNSNIGSCMYTVQPGDFSDDLNVKSVTGDIRNQIGVTMINFSPSTNLEYNKDIVIDTTAPNAPVITLLDPITNANKTAVTITGTGEANATIHYSIDDTKSYTNFVAGTGSVDPSGNINLTGIDLSSLDGGLITATVYLTDAASNQSLDATDTATSSVVRPTITNISSGHADGSFKEGEIIGIDLTFSEAVTSAEVTVTLETGTTDRSCTFSVAGSSSGSCNYTVQAGDTSSNLNVSEISGTITNADGNTMINFTPVANLADSKDIIIDTSAPVLSSFTSSKANGTYGPATSINITANYNENLSVGSTIVVMLDTGIQVALDTISSSTKLTGNYTVGATGSGENSDALTVSSIVSQNACDVAGNCQALTSLPASNVSDTSQIAVDTTPPEFINILPASSSNINSVTADSDLYYALSEDLLSATITFTRTAWAEDPGSPHVCILQGNYLLQGDHDRFDTSNCVGGSIDLVVGAMYTMTYQSEDLYGNIADEQARTGVTFGMDTNGPVISSITVSAVDSSSAVISWTTDENSSSLIDIGLDLTYGRTEGNLGDNVKNHIVTVRNLDPGETYLFRVRSSDISHHETIDDNSGVGHTFTTNALAAITGVEVKNITSTAATVTWNSDVNAYSYINYGSTESYGIVIGKEDAVTQAHSITIAGLLPSTTYYFRARVKDISGNYSIGSNGSFTTLAEGSDGSGNQNNQLPSISSIKTSDGDNGSVVVTWKTNKDCNGMVRFGLDKKYGQSAGEDATIYAADQFATSHEVILTKLLSNTTYNYVVVSYDSTGNIAISGNKTFKTPALSGISNVKVTDTTLNSAVIVWETSDPATSTVDYGLTTAYGKQFKNASLENMHKVELTSLEAGKTYHFRVNAQNKNSTSVSSDDYIFATIPKPVMGNYTIGEITDTKITLDWTTNVETDSVVSFVNRSAPDEKGEQGGSDMATAHKVTLSGLNEGTDYDIRISGTDANKNSFESEPFLVTTFKDTIAPEISQINTESSLIGGKEDKVQSIIYWKTDETATSQVVFDSKKGSEVSAYSQSSKEDANTSTNHVVVLTNLNSGSVYYFMVVSKDKNGNESHSEAFSLLTPRKEQSIIQMIIANFEETFGWMKKMKSN
jgi:hypothetical protein